MTLKSEDGETTTGALVEVNDQVVVVKTSIGLVAVPVNGATCIGQACPETIRHVSTAPVLTFVTPDGALAGQGQLLEISSDHYVIATDLGEVRLHVDEAFCAGTGCPTSVAESQFGGDVVLSNGAMTIEGQLVGVEGASYIVEVTNVGAVRVDTALFECSGAGCP